MVVIHYVYHLDPIILIIPQGLKWAGFHTNSPIPSLEIEWDNREPVLFEHLVGKPGSDFHLAQSSDLSTQKELLQDLKIGYMSFWIDCFQTAPHICPRAIAVLCRYNISRDLSSYSIDPGSGSMSELDSI
jgi:hypothetical protein